MHRLVNLLVDYWEWIWVLEHPCIQRVINLSNPCRFFSSIPTSLYKTWCARISIKVLVLLRLVNHLMFVVDVIIAKMMLHLHLNGWRAWLRPEVFFVHTSLHVVWPLRGWNGLLLEGQLLSWMVYAISVTCRVKSIYCGRVEVSGCTLISLRVARLMTMLTVLSHSIAVHGLTLELLWEQVGLWLIRFMLRRSNTYLMVLLICILMNRVV